MHRRPPRFVPIALAATLGAACTGSIDGSGGSLGDPADGRDPVAAPSPGAPASMSPKLGVSPPVVPGAPPPPASCGRRTPVAASHMRRLTNAEFTRTAVALLGLPVDTVLAVRLPGESRVHNFENDAASQSLGAGHLEGYLAATDGLLRTLAASATKRSSFFGCGAAGPDAACTRAFVTAFGRRAFRRPLAPDEIAHFVKLGTVAPGESDPYAGLDLVVQSMLASPHFLFMVEVGAPDPTRPGEVKLGPYELATRLAFLTFGMGPDDRLLDDAAAGKLSTPEGLVAAATAALADPRARVAGRQFAERWLRLDELAGVERDKGKFPGWSETLRASMLEESTLFLDDLLFRPGADFRDLLTADESFLDAALARHYGVPAPATAWTKQRLPPGQRGAGFLTQGTFLTVTAVSQAAAIIKRGQFVREVLLCQPLPPAPDEVPKLEEGKFPPTTSERNRLEMHRKAPECAGCHSLMDPLGFGFLAYDAIGAHRTADAYKQRIDDTGELSGTPFKGAAELGRLLRGSPEFARCATTNFLRHALGRELDAAESCTVGEISDLFAASGYRPYVLVKSLVATDTFRYRRAAPLAQTGGPK